MRKLISLFSVISLLVSTTNMVVSCGPGEGSEIKVIFNNPPEKQTANTNPQLYYVYNDIFRYQTDILNKALIVLMQLAADKIEFNKNDFINSQGKVAEDFYNSNAYKSNHYESINYNNFGVKSLIRAFTATDQKNVPLIFALPANDKTKQQIYSYWFVTHETPQKAQQPEKNDKTNLIQPTVEDFLKEKDKKIITVPGWIHLFFTINDNKSNTIFQIDFNIRIDISFTLITDKNKEKIVVVAEDTINKPVGNVDYDHPEYTFNDHDGKPGRISDMKISYKP